MNTSLKSTVTTNEGATETPISELVGQLGRSVKYVKLEHPNGILRLGLTDDLRRMHYRASDGSQFCTKRIQDDLQLISALEKFRNEGVLTDEFQWITTRKKNFFDYEQPLPVRRAVVKKPVPASTPSMAWVLLQLFFWAGVCVFSIGVLLFLVWKIQDEGNKWLRGERQGWEVQSPEPSKVLEITTPSQNNLRTIPKMVPNAETVPTAESVKESSVELPTTNTEKATIILGSTKEQVDDLLSLWNVRKSNRSTPSRPIYYYTRDVEFIVTFENEKAVGVAVIDRPGKGISPIPPYKVFEMIKLIGGTYPPKDVTKDRSGIREFSIGDAD